MAVAMSIEDIDQRLVEIESDVRALDEQYAGQAMSEPDREKWNGLNGEHDGLLELKGELEARNQRIVELAGDSRNVEEGATFHVTRPSAVRGDDIWDTSTVRTDPYADPEGTREELRDRALRAIDRCRFPNLENRGGSKKFDVNHEDVQGHIEGMLGRVQEQIPGQFARHLLDTGSPLYHRAFGKAMTGKHLLSEEMRALSTGATTGGQAVPFTLDPTIIPTSNSVVNPARALGRVESITGSNTWNGISSGAITATRVLEAGPATDNSPTMAAPTATVTKAHAFVPFSVEIQEDWVGMESELAQLFQDAKDDEEGAAFVTGVGTTVNPQGFVTGTTATSAAAGGLTVTAANLYTLEAALPPRFRPNESFVANRGIYNAIRAIDTAGGAALWLYVSQGLVTQAPSPGNTGALLLGRGAWEASAMQATIVNATKIMIVGDFNYFLILDRIGLHVELIPFLFGASQGNLPTGQRGIYCWWRNTSKVLSASAFVAMTGTT